ncbi:hypothetical protein DFO73_110208 [Cytobacillus oceanisediminis]|uniref:Uncharacterized protein n=1 Tax=Cytobacillus oceanisediminis TaxID=665099 RepID=A0A2V2ZZH0_9BACI|nr:hypothetical protein DFO73_110208 [Cytobacillus oceanisediminis]
MNSYGNVIRMVVIIMYTNDPLPLAVKKGVAPYSFITLLSIVGKTRSETMSTVLTYKLSAFGTVSALTTLKEVKANKKNPSKTKNFLFFTN